jgi:hypothetical protein
MLTYGARKLKHKVHCHVHISSPSVCFPIQIKTIHTRQHHILLESLSMFSSHILMPKSANRFLPFTASDYLFILFPSFALSLCFFYSFPSILHTHSFIHLPSTADCLSKYNTALSLIPFMYITSPPFFFSLHFTTKVTFLHALNYENPHYAFHRIHLPIPLSCIQKLPSESCFKQR